MQHQQGQGIHKANGRRPGEAQRRFRERQKANMRALQDTVADKTAELARLAAENELLRTRSRTLEQLVLCRDQQVAILERVRENLTGPVASHQGGCFGPFGQDCAMLPDASIVEQFRGYDSEMLLASYKSFLAEASAILVSPNPAAAEVALAPHVMRMASMLKTMVVLKPQLMMRLAAINISTGELDAPREEHWQAVATSLSLSPLQRKDLVAHFQLVTELGAKVAEERHLVKLALNMGRSTGAVAMDLIEKLHTNLRKERSCKQLMCCFFYGKLVSTSQFATCMVKSYPFFPCVWSIACVVASEHLGRALH